MNTLTKAELVELLATETALSKADLDKALKGLTKIILEQVAKDTEVAIPDLGKFTKTHRAERQGRNPQTGKALTIAAKNAPAFKAAKAFKDAVN